MSRVYPMSRVVWPGALLATVFHAVFICRAPFMSSMHSWDGLNYNVQNGEGSRGTIAFGGNGGEFVGVFYFEESSRNPLKRRGGNADYVSPVRGVPEKFMRLSEKALAYVHEDVDGVSRPVITSAFWSGASGGRIEANEEWASVLEHGAVLVSNELSSVDVAMERWVEGYELEGDAVDFVKSVFELRLRHKERRLILDLRRLGFLRELSSDEEGFRASLETFGEIGIQFEGGGD